MLEVLQQFKLKRVWSKESNLTLVMAKSKSKIIRLFKKSSMQDFVILNYFIQLIIMIAIIINYVVEVALCYIERFLIWWMLRRFLFPLLWGKTLIKFGSMKVEMNTSVSDDPNTFSVQNEQFDVMMLLQCIIASVGIIANLTVVIVFLNHKELRRKIPNRFIINQVGIFSTKLLLKKEILY